MKSETMKLLVEAKAQNESFARAVVGAFASRINPNLEQLSDIQTAVSEAVTNCIVHGYNGKVGNIEITATIEGKSITIEITDHGWGISDVDKARQAFYTTCADMERSGMGFTIMEAFMDEVKVSSTPGIGTTVSMTKEIVAKDDECVA